MIKEIYWTFSLFIAEYLDLPHFPIEVPVAFNLTHYFTECDGDCGGQKRTWDALELMSQVVVSHMT